MDRSSDVPWTADLRFGTPCRPKSEIFARLWLDKGADRGANRHLAALMYSRVHTWRPVCMWCHYEFRWHDAQNYLNGVTYSSVAGSCTSSRLACLAPAGRRRRHSPCTWRKTRGASTRKRARSRPSRSCLAAILHSSTTRNMLASRRSVGHGSALPELLQ